MKRWVVAAKKADFNAIASKYNISPYLARIIRNRDVISDEDIYRYLNGNVEDMHNPALLKDCDEAAGIIIEAIEAGSRIRIIGDYDIDGVLASYILAKSIRMLGGEADVRLPDRIKDGYGMNEDMINEAAGDGVELIVTCDNGIAASKEVALANELGISVVVTDHHEVPFETEGDQKRYIIPTADAVVDPKQEDCNYPFEGICGAMVAYKVILRVVGMMQEEGLMGDTMPADSSVAWAALKNELLQFAAFATVGDIMELKDENRIAVKHGLKAMGDTSNVGLKALIEVTGIGDSVIEPYHIGFILGPCVNATGRLDSAMRALDLFFCDDYVKALKIAGELFDINKSRKQMTEDYTAQAIDMVTQQSQAAGSVDKVIVLYLKDCHESLAGIVAGRVREAFYRPTIVLTKGEDGVKGSARSIDDYNMFEELNKVKHLFTKFGGHKMAAGMSLDSEDKIDELRQSLNSSCSLTDEELIEKYVIDIPMPISYVTMNFIKELDKLAPFGVGNAKPLFACKDVPISELKLLGKSSNVLKMKLHMNTGNGMDSTVDGICFDNAKDNYQLMENKETVSILYSPQINEYNGNRSIQIQIKDWY